ncbi:hypothetical protein MMC13_005955 [Lambiella insularis]|nr:hypothetical protein [Lambiella insularis]
MAPDKLRKTVLITGCSAGGIGDALARSFYCRGYHVFATARDLSKVKHLKEMGLTVLRLDVVDAASLKAAVKAVSATTEETLDILVNNSGIGYSTPILDADLEHARKLFHTNFFGRLAVAQAFSPLLIKSKGTIINIGSISGVNPTPWSGIYNASCAAVHMWSDTFRIEMEPFGVKVILVITGAVQSLFLENLPVKHLIEGSMYSPAREIIEASMNGAAAGDSSMSAEDYAQHVIANALKSSPKKRQWTGGLATLIWIASTFLWATAWDLILAKPFGITELKSKLKRS